MNPIQSHARGGCFVPLAPKSTLHHYMVTFLIIRKLLVMEINYKIIHGQSLENTIAISGTQVKGMKEMVVG